MNKLKTKLLLATFLVAIAIAICTVNAKAQTDVDINATNASNLTVTFDIESGTLTVIHTGKDTTFWHPGQIGEVNQFDAAGDFEGTYIGQTSGPYGGLFSRVNAESDSWASFWAQDWQHFNVLSGNHIYNTDGYFAAWASGDPAEMNMKFVGSMYVWSEATNPYYEPCLLGSSIGKHAVVTQSGVLEGDLLLAVSTTGFATLQNSNIWGWGISEGGSAYTNYGGGTRSVSATGNGIYQQNGYGKDHLRFNGLEFPSGGYVSLTGYFIGGISGTYDMEGD